MINFSHSGKFFSDTTFEGSKIPNFHREDIRPSHPKRLPLLKTPIFVGFFSPQEGAVELQGLILVSHKFCPKRVDWKNSQHGFWMFFLVKQPILRSAGIETRHIKRVSLNFIVMHTLPRTHPGLFRKPQEETTTRINLRQRLLLDDFLGQARCQLFFCTLPKVEPLEPENGSVSKFGVSEIRLGVYDFSGEAFRWKKQLSGGSGRLWRTSRHPRWCDRKVCNVRNFSQVGQVAIPWQLPWEGHWNTKKVTMLWKNSLWMFPYFGDCFWPFKTRSFSKQNKVHQRVQGSGSFRVEHLRLYVRLHVIQIALKSFLVWCPKQNCLPQIPPPPPLDTTCRRSNRVRQAKWTALQGPSQDKSYQDLLQLLWPLVTWSMSLLMQAAHW